MVSGLSRDIKDKQLKPVQPIAGARSQSPAGFAQQAHEPAPPLTTDAILQLQRTIGNRAVSMLAEGAGTADSQPGRLRVGPPVGPAEEAAERAAAQFSSSPSGSALQANALEHRMRLAKPLKASLSVPAKHGAGRDADSTLRRSQRLSPLPAQQAGSAGGFTLGPDIEAQLAAARGSGQPLPAVARGQMEIGFGADFGAVRLHTGAQADRLNRTLGAQAFTHGRDIYLAGGKDNLASKDGRQLLAHELTHTIQQGGGAPARIQRRLDFTRAQLSQGQRFKASVAKRFSRDQEFSKIIRALDAYWDAPKISLEVRYLKLLQSLVLRWQSKQHGNDLDKAAVISRLQAALMAEIPEAENRHRLFQEKQEREYMEGMRDPAKRKQKYWFEMGGINAGLEGADNLAAGNTNAKAGQTDEALKLKKRQGLSDAQISAIRTFTAEDYNCSIGAMR